MKLDRQEIIYRLEDLADYFEQHLKADDRDVETLRQAAAYLAALGEQEATAVKTKEER